MDDKDSIERFLEGLKKAASRSRELGALKQDNVWFDIAKTLDQMRKNGTLLLDAPTPVEADVASMLTVREKTVH